MESAMLQGLFWSRAAQDWAELQEPLAMPLWEMLLDAAAVRAGTRLLDAGCGAGGASVLAARRAASVNGLDAAEALLAIARQRVPDGDFRLGDLEDLPYAGGTFDAILAVDVLPYVAVPLTALGELRRVCAPGGRIAIAVWGTAEESEHHAILASVRASLPLPLGLEPCALSVPGAFDALLVQAGLRADGGGTVGCPAEYPDQETAWQAQAAAGPMQAVLRVLGEHRLKAAVLRAFAPFTTNGGAVRLQQRARYVLAVPDVGGRGGAEKGGAHHELGSRHAAPSPLHQVKE
jgi:SAM-dependent methyltransferase